MGKEQHATTPAAAGSEAGWTEHRSPAGIPYYYNTITKVSTYERPSSLPPSSPGKAAPVASPSPVAPAKSSSKETKGAWNTYTDEATGRKYYSDGATVTWKRPVDLPPEDADENNPKSSNKRGASSTAEDDEGGTNKARKPKKKKASDKEITPYSNKAEAVAAFKGLLLAKDIAPTTKWNDVVRICSLDPRWEACTTLGERKQALAEYQTKRANELRDVKRQEKVRAKEAYQRLLTDLLPSVRGFSPGASRFMDVREALAKDDRFYAVEDETTREELFYDFVEELRKREERTKRNKKRDAKEGFLAFLNSHEEQGKLTFASTWSSFVSSLDEAEKTDSRFSVSAVMSDSDRQLYFADHVIELQAAEDERRRRIRDARRRAEKAQRDAYRVALRNMSESGTILPSTRWRSIEERVGRDPSFEPVHEQGREIPRELFEDFVDEWSEEYRRDRTVLNRLVGSAKKELTVCEDTKYDDYTKALLDASAHSPDLYGEVRRMLNRENPVSSVRLFFNEEKASSKSANRNGTSNAHQDKSNDDSSDEGEIVEDGEVEEAGADAVPQAS